MSDDRGPDDHELSEQELDPRVNDRTGRPSGYQPRFCVEVRRLALLGLANTDRQVAAFFGVAISTIGAWKTQFPDFSDAMEGGKTPADCIVAEKLLEKACGYEWIEEQAIKVKTIIYGDNGKKLKETEEVKVVEVQKRLPPDTLAIKFWLMNRQAQLWREGAPAGQGDEAKVDLTNHYAKMGANFEHPPRLSLVKAT